MSQAGLLPPADPNSNPALLTALDAPGAGILSPGSGVTPQEAAQWWASLTLAERLAVMAAYPHRLGGADGLPAEVRDEANRLLLARDIATLSVKEHNGTITDEEQAILDNARKTQQQIEAYERHVDPISGETPPVQLYIYDPGAFGGDGRIAISMGDMDQAEHVAFAVPGLGTEVPAISPGARVPNIYNESRWASGDSVAVVEWIGYDAPSGSITGGDTVGVINQDLARSGAQLLAADVAAFNDSRLGDDAHVTVIGNSYGSTTSLIAADEFGLQADDLVVTGSPGAGHADDAGDLTTGRDHTWVGSNSRDAVTALGRTGWTDPSEVLGEAVDARLPLDIELMGNDPAEDTFGANRFQAEHTERGDSWNFDDHSHYYDQDSESLYNIAAVVTGQYADVNLAEYRTDPLADVDAGVDLQSPVEVRRGWLGIPVIEFRSPVEDVHLDADVMMQDPERDRTPTERTHEPA